MHTEKKCVSCLKLFTDGSPGIGGVFKGQSFAAGVCPECSKKQEVRRRFEQVAEEVYDGQADRSDQVVSQLL